MTLTVSVVKLHMSFRSFNTHFHKYSHLGPPDKAVLIAWKMRLTSDGRIVQKTISDNLKYACVIPMEYQEIIV